MANPSPKVTLITGASSGIGLEVAKQLSNKHKLILVGRRAQGEIDHQFDDNIRYIQTDFSNSSEAVGHVVQKLEEFGVKHLDHVIQCAGMGSYASPLDEDMAEIGKTLNVNMLFPILLTRQLASILEASKGKVTLIGSVAHKGSPQMASYAASKAGISGFARSLQSEWQGRIDVQVLHPGPTLTPMFAKAGYKLGLERHVFVPVKMMASEIIRLINSNKKSATIFVMAKLKSLFIRGTS